MASQSSNPLSGDNDRSANIIQISQQSTQVTQSATRGATGEAATPMEYMSQVVINLTRRIDLIENKVKTVENILNG